MSIDHYPTKWERNEERRHTARHAKHLSFLERDEIAREKARLSAGRKARQAEDARRLAQASAAARAIHLAGPRNVTA